MKDLNNLSIGTGKILRNLMLPQANGEDKPIDRLLIHETGLYIFEIREEEGIISGSYKDATWTSSARKRPDQSFDNPIRTLASREEALQTMFPDVSVHLFIVFAAEQNDVQVTDWEFTRVTVCRADEAEDHLRRTISAARGGLRPQKINEIFRQLQPYAEADLSEEVKTTGDPADYADRLSQDYMTIPEQPEPEAVPEESAPNKKRQGLIKAAAICLTTIAICAGLGMLVKHMIDKWVDENTLDSRWVDAYVLRNHFFSEAEALRKKDEEIFYDAPEEFYSLSEVQLMPVYDPNTLESDSVIFSCIVRAKADYILGFELGGASYIVGFKDGTKTEYENITEGTYSDKSIYSYKCWEIGPLLINHAKISDIAYIKLRRFTIQNSAGLYLSYEQDSKKNDFLHNEITLYSAE